MNPEAPSFEPSDAEVALPREQTQIVEEELVDLSVPNAMNLKPSDAETALPRGQIEESLFTEGKEMTIPGVITADLGKDFAQSNEEAISTL